MSIKPQIRLTDAVSIAFETNGKGYIGFIGELPGAFIRGKTEEEALSKIDREVKSYLRWLSVSQNWRYDVVVVQRHRSSLMVEDADTEILLKVDKAIMSEEEFEKCTDLAWYSGATFSGICSVLDLMTSCMRQESERPSVVRIPGRYRRYLTM